MGNETKNYKLPKPGEEDFYDISEYNQAMDLLDETLTDLNDRKMDSDGNASDVITEFSQEILRENIESGEKLSVSHGKIQKWFSEIKNIAFSGLASDAAQDAAHRFVTDSEKKNWNAKVSASGGDISGTKIGTLETATSEFPVPVEGETSKVFLGKVKKFIENVKPLEAAVTFYVATTGSDTNGDGTQENPFKTIQKAIDMVPKNLNNLMATIMLADGVYDNISISGFSIGTLFIRPSARVNTLNNECVVKNIVIRSCRCMVHLNSLNVVESTAKKVIDIDRANVVRLDHLRIVQPNPSWVGIEAYMDSSVIITECEISNHANAIYADFSRIFVSKCTGSGNNYSLNVSSGGRIVCDGTLPGWTVGFAIQNTGGSIFNQNGTQIWDMGTTGISCLWGYIIGGYVRNGNRNGIAIVTLQLRVNVTTALTAGTEYSITGFPYPPSAICIASSNNNVTTTCFMDTNGTLYWRVNQNITVGSPIMFNATYLTNG